jgi:hypothetical protein
VNDASGNITVGGTLAATIVRQKTATNAYNNYYTDGGTTTNSGFAGVFNSSGTRIAYLGFWDSNNIVNMTEAAYGITFGTNSSERMRIDSSGNVGIGTSSPGAKLQVTDGNFNQLYLLSSTTVSGIRFGNTAYTNGYIYYDNGANLTFQTNGSERARINTSGNLLVGSTNTNVGIGDLTTVNGSQLSPAGFVGATRTDEAAAYFTRNNSDGRIANFYRNATGVGGISVTTTSTSFNTSSDYRLKYDVQPMTTGLATVVALNPVTYKWNSNDTYGEGFIAHELQEVVPAAVDGDKDAVDANGNIVAQSVDYSKIVVHLVAACQELKAQNDELKARVAALEAK